MMLKMLWQIVVTGNNEDRFIDVTKPHQPVREEKLCENESLSALISSFCTLVLPLITI